LSGGGYDELIGKTLRDGCGIARVRPRDGCETRPRLAEGVERLGLRGDLASEAADAAVKCDRHLEHVYRVAMAALLETDDLREVTARRELYRRCSRIGETVVDVAERVRYAVVKES
jgi:hypothetical protein